MKRISGTILIAFAALALMTLPLSAQTSVPAAGTAQPAAADQQKTETQPAQTDAAPVQSESIPQARPLKPSPMQVGEPETEESLLVSAEWLKKNRGQVVLVDARPESLYAGGHIPGAVNVPVSQCFAEGGRLPDDELLRALLDRTGPLAAYCGSGVSAAQLVLAGAALDRSIALYPGSWSAWSNDPSRPVATGEH